MRPDKSLYEPFPIISSIFTTVQERNDSLLTCNGNAENYFLCSPFAVVIISLSHDRSVVQRSYLPVVELFGIIGGFFEVLWFFGVFIISPYNNIVKQFIAVKEVYGESFVKERTGFTSFGHYFRLSFVHLLWQITCLCGLCQCQKARKMQRKTQVHSLSQSSSLG